METFGVINGQRPDESFKAAANRGEQAAIVGAASMNATAAEHASGWDEGEQGMLHGVGHVAQELIESPRA